MAEKPLLILPNPKLSSFKRKGIPIGKPHFPTIERQHERLSPQFERLERAFEARCFELKNDPAGAAPEQVLVLETIGTIQDFIVAVRNIPGMEWLGEWDEEEIPPDEDFFQDEKHKDKPLGGRLFLIMTDQQAMTELLSLWQRYPSADLGHGRAKWRNLFQQLRNIRPWGVQDRLLETGLLEDWRERVKAGEESIRFEAELWFRNNPDQQRASLQFFESLLRQEGGKLLGQSVIPEIAYHGILAELSIQAIQVILEHPDTRLVRCDHVMFFRPSGQSAVKFPEDKPLAGPQPPEPLSLPQGLPIVALLDGLPLENHDWLSGRLIVDDPDGWSADYPAQTRHHGTAMASLILHGELDANEPPLERPLYVRPILKPDLRDWRTPKIENIPENILPIDLAHRAVRRLFEGEGEEPPVAPEVRIINFSIGDPSRQFDRFLSPMARLLDWLAWRYQVLFVVSAGNHQQEIVLNLPRTALANLQPEQLQAETIKAIADDVRHRRLLAPAEAVNVLTVGALHADSSTSAHLGQRIDPFCSDSLPNPVNALGLGFRRSIKPEILFKGGRQLYEEKFGNLHSNATLCINTASLPPGQKVAAPSTLPGDLSAIRYLRGTSNATALVTRTAGLLHEVIANLRQEASDDLLDDHCTAVLLKAMLVHSSSWGGAQLTLQQILRTPSNSHKLKEHIARFLGYGRVEPDRVFACTDQRATLLGYSKLTEGNAHTYSVPLPQSLSGKKLWRRLAITLAWITPINCSHRAYRRAALWFEPPADSLLVKRQEADGKAVQRGTVQHEILEGEKAAAYTDRDGLDIKVKCRADAGDLPDEIPYAIVVTLEVAEDVDIAIYEEIRQRIRLPVIIAPETISNR
ncbi:S8 family peptidase [candidate division KSB1 bacterium]|nr:S8 family peptidase [candidate division KSB1 bacterium]